MNIAVWCASEPGTDPAYLEAAEQLGTWIGSAGHTLVYGGSRGGLMGAVADAVLAAGGQVTGVTVDVPRIKARLHPGLTRVEVRPTMAERKQAMIDLADVFVALPGGVGTLDEITDVLTAMRCNTKATRMALVDVNGFYTELQAFFAKMVTVGFIPAEAFSNVLVSADFAEITAFLTTQS